MVTAALVVGVSLLQADAAPRLRTQLTNGASMIVERTPALKSCSIAIAFRADRCGETPETHGWRHLLEHLAAKGKDGALDKQLESRGWMATAWTYRDSMVFAAIGSKAGLSDAIQALSSIPRFRKTTKEAINLESRIIAQEAALLAPAQSYSNRAWRDAFDARGLDAWGSASVIGAATPSDVARVATQQFDARGMAVAIVGDVNVAETTALAKKAFEEVTASDWPILEVDRKPADRPTSPGGLSVELPPAGGDGWIAKVGAALSLSASDTTSVNSLFSISFRPGLLSIYPEPRPEAIVAPESGRYLFLNWLETIERNALALATATAQLAIVSPDLSVDRLRADAGGLPAASYAAAAKEMLK